MESTNRINTGWMASMKRMNKGLKIEIIQRMESSNRISKGWKV